MQEEEGEETFSGLYEQKSEGFFIGIAKRKKYLIEQWKRLIREDVKLIKVLRESRLKLDVGLK